MKHRKTIYFVINLGFISTLISCASLERTPGLVCAKEDYNMTRDYLDTLTAHCASLVRDTEVEGVGKDMQGEKFADFLAGEHKIDKQPSVVLDKMIQAATQKLQLINSNAFFKQMAEQMDKEFQRLVAEDNVKAVNRWIYILFMLRGGLISKAYPDEISLGTMGRPSRYTHLLEEFPMKLFPDVKGNIAQGIYMAALIERLRQLIQQEKERTFPGNIILRVPCGDLMAQRDEVAFARERSRITRGNHRPVSKTWVVNCLRSIGASRQEMYDTLNLLIAEGMKVLHKHSGMLCTSNQALLSCSPSLHPFLAKQLHGDSGATLPTLDDASPYGYLARQLRQTHILKWAASTTPSRHRRAKTQYKRNLRIDGLAGMGLQEFAYRSWMQSLMMYDLPDELFLDCDAARKHIKLYLLLQKQQDYQYSRYDCYWFSRYFKRSVRYLRSPKKVEQLLDGYEHNQAMMDEHQSLDALTWALKQIYAHNVSLLNMADTPLDTQVFSYPKPPIIESYPLWPYRYALLSDYEYSRLLDGRPANQMAYTEHFLHTDTQCTEPLPDLPKVFCWWKDKAFDYAQASFSVVRSGSFATVSRKPGRVVGKRQQRQALKKKRQQQARVRRAKQAAKRKVSNQYQHSHSPHDAGSCPAQAASPVHKSATKTVFRALENRDVQQNQVSQAAFSASASSTFLTPAGQKTGQQDVQDTNADALLFAAVPQPEVAVQSSKTLPPTQCELPTLTTGSEEVRDIASTQVATQKDKEGKKSKKVKPKLSDAPVRSVIDDCVVFKGYKQELPVRLPPGMRYFKPASWLEATQTRLADVPQHKLKNHLKAIREIFSPDVQYTKIFSDFLTLWTGLGGTYKHNGGGTSHIHCLAPAIHPYRPHPVKLGGGLYRPHGASKYGPNYNGVKTIRTMLLYVGVRPDESR